MFEKWRLKEHMEVTDSEGRHIGTVDEVEGDRIKLTRTDAADGRHQYLEVSDVDRIAENRAWLKPGVTLPGTSPAMTAEERHQANNRLAEDYAGQHSSPGAAADGGEAPLFGTSGHGTGMGGSGAT